MPTITFDQVTKKFGSTSVIESFSAEVPDKEFLVLLGPSGCGKSTMLRMIAGLLEVSDGQILFDGRRVDHLEPKARDVAFVFQSYALYPHMTVRENIAFPLLMRKFRWWGHVPVLSGVWRRRLLKGSDILDPVERIAAAMELGVLLDRKPRTLSGGQRQRVALARALVREPSVYLLDEPLSNLDAKLRTQMRGEISTLYRRVKSTFVYVTHDQVEAMTMGTRIIVLNEGQVQQYGTPEEIYARPSNVFVARFIGSPPMNLLRVHRSDRDLIFPDGTRSSVPIGTDVPSADAFLLGVRAEKIRISSGTGVLGLPGRVEVVERLGAESVVGFRLVGADEGATDDVYFARMPGSAVCEPGDLCTVELDFSGASFFDLATGVRLQA